MLWTTGAVLPIRRLGELARSAGAVMIADGAQAAGAIPVSVEELGVDAYALAGQKWLLGPEGMAALWVAAASPDSLTPAHASFLSYEVFDPRAAGAAAGARRFEATGYHRPSVVGLARSLRLDLDVRGARRGRTSARPAWRPGAADRLAAIPGSRS